MNRRNAIRKLSVMGAGFLAIPHSIKSISLFADPDQPEAAWNSLDPATVENYVFRYIEPVEHLPQVFLYGDSISIGYTEYTRAALEGQACVHRLYRNGESSNVFIKNMEILRKTMFRPYNPQGWDFNWDLIHINVGLHDLKYVVGDRLDRENGKQVSSIAVYQVNLREIIEYLGETWPDARLVFATTTPVPPDSAGRDAGDAARYNQAAREVLAGYRNVMINDLYELVRPDFAKLAIRPGNVHFTPDGYRILGQQVASVIARELKLQTVPIPDDATLEKRRQEYGKI